ncbi:MAG: phosphatase PAP2 family protein [Bacteroidota bacterium]
MFLLFVSCTVSGYTQQPDSLLKKLDSLEKKADTAGQVNIINPIAYNETTRINVPVYFTLLASNMKQQFTAPFRASKKDWGNVAKFALVTGALAFADRPLQKAALRWRKSSGTVRNVSGFITEFGYRYEVVTLAVFGAYGFIFKQEKMRTTTLLASQAFITGSAVGMLSKYITGRQRPGYFGADSTLARATFHGPFSVFGTKYNGNTFGSSFPSGHTTVAFAAATVFAMEYRDKPIIPIIAYSAASLIGISRVTENKHWATDVLVGAALGYLSGRQVVNNYHRYAKIKNDEKRKGKLTFNLQYTGGQLVPGMVYKF